MFDPMLAVELSPVGVGLTVLVSVVTVALVGGVVAGQFRAGIVNELRAALATANTEIDIERKRSDRLEEEARQLRTEVVALRTEVATLRSVLTDDRALAKLLAEELAVTHRAEIDEILNAIGNGCSRIIERIDQDRTFGTRGQAAREKYIEEGP